jgi:hypothetical protein
MLLAESTRLLSLFTPFSPKGGNDEKILSSKGRHFFNVTMRFTTTDMIINNLDQLLTGEMFHYL